MHKDPASCILCNITFEIRNFLSGTALCTSHHHTPANPVEMPFGEEKASRERQRQTGFTSVITDKDFKYLPMHNQHIIWQHFGHVFVCKGCGKEFHTNISIHRHKKLLLVGQGLPSFRIKEELKIKEENNGRKNTSELLRFEKL